MRIEITKSATRQKNKLTKNNRQLDELFNTAIDELPKGDIKKLKLGSNEYRLRVGRYRVLFSKGKDTITIHTINDRKTLTNSTKRKNNVRTFQISHRRR